MTDIWTPHLTVAAVIEKEGKFLLVEERSEGKIVLNQPAGHVEENETIIEAVIRETLEESGRPFQPEAISGIYRWRSPDNGITYLRLAFFGAYGKRDRDLALDTDIITTHWFTPDELQQRAAELRSPLVMRCIDDYRAGKRYPLKLVEEIR
jgi:8-oxo-dGTP pyrophosphatase MutT (NUDIX family)